MRAFAVLSLFSALAVGLPACGDQGGADPNVIRIGVAGPITGGQARNGEDLVDGVTLAVEERNAAGGLLGKTIEVVSRDDEALDKNAPTVARELVDAGVVGVIGHFNSGCTIPASRVYHEAGIVTITPASTNTYVTERGFNDVFRVCGRDDQQGRAAADFIAGPLGAKRVAIYDDKTAYGQGLAEECEVGLGDRVEIVIREGFDQTERNFRPYLTKLREADVDVWYFGGIFEQAAPMLLQARQLGIEAPMMSGDGVHGYKVEFLDKVGPGADGTLTTFPDTQSAPGYAEFLKKYNARFKGEEPGPYAIYSYASALILLDAIAAAGTTEGAALAQAIHAGEWNTPVGKVVFDDKGDVTAMDYYKIWVVRDGKHVLWDGGR